MKKYTQELFDLLADRDSGTIFEDLELNECTFDNCILSYTKAPSRVSTVRNVRLTNCTSVNCDIGPTIFEDVVVEGLRTNQLLIAWGPLFKHVIFNGDIGQIKFNIEPGADWSPSVMEPFARARSAFYADVDWALDITNANFKVFDMRGVPARLVRRDPETQVVVTRDRALGSGWQANVSSWNTYWPDIIDMFISDDLGVRYGETDIVLVAPKRMSKRRLVPLIEGLRELRELGVAEPD